MTEKRNIQRERAEKSKAKATEAARKAKLHAKAVTEGERKDDTRRKILAGSWALDKAEKSSEFASDMHRELTRHWLVRDDDRALFNLPALSETEKAQRGVSNTPSKKQSGKAPDVSSSPSPAVEREIAAE